MTCRLGRSLLQGEAAALVALSLLTVQPVLAHRWATTLQNLKCRSLQAAANQFRKWIRPASRFPAGNRYQQTVLRQVALQNPANRLQSAHVLIPAQRQNQLAHGSAVPGGCPPGQWAQAFDRSLCQTQALLAGLAEI